jgi:hypothetical protein
MVMKRRDIGAEILQGLQEIKRGDIGRVIKVPDIARTRKGFSQARFVQMFSAPIFAKTHRRKR